MQISIRADNPSTIFVRQNTTVYNRTITLGKATFFSGAEDPLMKLRRKMI